MKWALENTFLHSLFFLAYYFQIPWQEAGESWKGGGGGERS